MLIGFVVQVFITLASGLRSVMPVRTKFSHFGNGCFRKSELPYSLSGRESIDGDVGWIVAVGRPRGEMELILVNSGSDEHVCPVDWHVGADLAIGKKATGPIP